MDVFLLPSETRTNVRPSFTTNFVRFIVEPRWGTKFVVHLNPVCAVRHWALEWNCVAVLCSRSPTRQPHRNRGVKPLLQLKTFTLEPASEAGPFSFSLFFDHDQDHDQDQD